MRALEQIAVGYDRGERGRDALVLGELLARTADAELVAVRVVDGATAPEQGAEETLAAELAEDLGDSPVRRRARVIGHGPAARALGDLVADEPGIGALALGSTHRAGFGRVLPGSTAERLLAGARCSIAVAPRGYASAGSGPLAESPRVVAVGYDASPEAEAALALARELAQDAQATMRVIAISTPVTPGWDPGAAAAEATPGVDLQSRLHEAVATLPDELRALPVHERGAPARRLLEHAEEGVDLLVMGSRGHGPVGAVLVGATSSAVINDSPCPVIVVPRPALDSP